MSLPAEGARWGDDPVPPPPPPSLQSKEEALRQRYGDANYSRALDIRAAIRTNYPHVALLRNPSEDFAQDLLARAEECVANAASDGHQHSVPETLNLFAESLGKFLLLNPNRQDLTGLRVRYPEEIQEEQAQFRKVYFDYVENFFKHKGRALDTLAIWFVAYLVIAYFVLDFLIGSPALWCTALAAVFFIFLLARDYKELLQLEGLKKAEPPPIERGQSFALEQVKRGDGTKVWTVSVK